MSQTRLVLLVALALCVASPLALAAPTIIVGTHHILPAPGQVVELYVTGGDLVRAFDLMNWIGNNVSGPVITAVDMSSAGHLFAGAVLAGTRPPPNSLNTRRTSAYAITLADRPADGLLATVTFDATGVPSGSYSWSLTDHPALPTLFYTSEEGIDVPTNIVNGFLIVPEPSSIVLGSLAAAALVVVALRRRNYPGGHGQETTMRRLLKDG